MVCYYASRQYHLEFTTVDTNNQNAHYVFQSSIFVICQVKWKCLPYADATYEKDTYLKEHWPLKLKAYEDMKNADTKPNNTYKVLTSCYILFLL